MSSLFLPSAQISHQVRSLAEQISKAHGQQDVVLVGVANAALYLLADVSRALRIAHEIEHVFVSTYRDNVRTATPQPVFSCEMDRFRNKQVIIVDCIADTGVTLAAVKSRILEYKPFSVNYCVLLARKTCACLHEIQYVGEVVSTPSFFIGYGLDHEAGQRKLSRYLSDIYTI